jgi:hypothetical protein
MGNGDSPKGAKAAFGRPRVSAYMYPWDVIGDPDVVSRLSSAGLERVSVAAAYHSVRAATPLHPQHRFVTAETAALYRPARAAVWAGRRLSPLGAPWTGSDNSFAQAVEALSTRGVQTSAWIVMTHNSALGRDNRDLVVRNCFGDAYEWALCPANEEVREYAALLACEAVRGLRLEGISLEACGQLGAAHGGHHDKTAGTYSPLGEVILSICCCAACQRTWSVRGLDTASVVPALQAAFKATLHAVDATPEDVLGTPLAAELLAVRQRHLDALFDEVLTELRAEGISLPITLHAQPNPWATGASPGLTPTSARRAHTVLVPVEPTSSHSEELIAATRALVPEDVDIAAYLSLLGSLGTEDIGEHAKRLVDAGAGELHLYHFGLANEQQLRFFSELASLSFSANERPCH